MFSNRTVFGPDVSKWQDDNNTTQKMDFSKVADAGGVFVFIKASQGTWKDEDFDDNRANAKDAGLCRGYYHFADKTYGSVKNQAETFWNAIKDDPGELPPVLDFESRGGEIGLSWIKYFLEYITDKWNEGKPEEEHRNAILYTGVSFWNDLIGSENATWALAYPLWIAYPDTGLAQPIRGIPDDLMDGPRLPNVWIKYNVKPLFWQYTWVADGNYFGAESKGLDLNLFNGDIEDFFQYVGEDSVDPGDPQEPTDPEIPELSEYARITCNFLRLRNAPNFEQKNTLIGEMGQEFKILERIPLTSGIIWYRIAAPDDYNMEGYLYMSAVRKYSTVVVK
jgi:lysozyme